MIIYRGIYLDKLDKILFIPKICFDNILWDDNIRKKLQI